MHADTKAYARIQKHTYEYYSIHTDTKAYEYYSILTFFDKILKGKL